MKWHDILKSKYDIKDIDLETFAQAGSKMKYFIDKHGTEYSAREHLESIMQRLISSILQHKKMRTKDRMAFKRVASAKGVTLEQSRIYDNIGISGSKIIKPIFPIPLDVQWWYDLTITMYQYDENNMVYGVLNINTEGSELLIRKIVIAGHEPYKFIIDKDISIKKPDREIAKLIKDLQKDGYDVLLNVTTDMKYRNGTSIDIKPYLEHFYSSEHDYGKLMAKIRQDAVLAVPKKTLFEERVEREKLNNPRENLWDELRDTYKKRSERWGEEME